jgi:hypothetical protein
VGGNETSHENVMTPWVEGVTVTLALVVGVIAGWLIGALSRLRLPNALVTTLALAAGSLGGPVVTTLVLGPGLLAHSLALLIAGLTIGLAYWPLGERPGKRQWF